MSPIDMEGILKSVQAIKDIRAAKKRGESQSEKDEARDQRPILPSTKEPTDWPSGVTPGMRKGGRVKKTGMYRVHKGERVVGKRAHARSKAR